MTTMTTTTDPAAGASLGYTEAEPASVREWLSAGRAVLVDVREPDEHAREKIAGATLLALSKFDVARAAGLARPGQKLVIHCRSGRRSAEACRRLAPALASGVALVNLRGGIEAWKQAGLPVDVNTRAARVSVMRQVQLIIGAGVLAGSALAWLAHPGFLALPAFFGAGLVFAGATGTCALASLVARLPWNRAGLEGGAASGAPASGPNASGSSCCGGSSCG